MKSDTDICVEAQALLNSLNFMNLGTCSLQGQPWSAPLYFSHDDQMNFFWLSSPHAVHSQHIEENPNVVITVFGSTRGDWDGFGLYFTAVASQIDEANLDAIYHAHTTAYKRVGQDPLPPETFTGEFPRRYYSARPTDLWINDVEIQNGVRVDVRRQIPLACLISQP